MKLSRSFLEFIRSEAGSIAKTELVRKPAEAWRGGEVGDALWWCQEVSL